MNNCILSQKFFQNTNSVNFSKNNKSNTQSSQIYMSTVPKSGTHLLGKILDSMHVRWSFHENIHLKPKYLKYLKGQSANRLFNGKFIILYRDPRDSIVSQIFFKLKTSPNKIERVNGKKIYMGKMSNYSLSELIEKSLDPTKITDDGVGYYASRVFDGTRMAAILKKHPDPTRLLVRFEDLIPTFAGGAKEKRRYQIFEKIVKFTGAVCPEVKIRKIMKNCWGGTLTFSSKEPQKVGQWKKYYQPHHIKLFHKNYNQLLLDLGYESDPDWHLKYLENNDQKQLLVS